MIIVQNLDVSIESVSILRNISLRVDTGQFAGLIGRNGAGKTTLMRSIMGLLPYNKGSIKFDTHDLNSLPAHQRAYCGIGYMPEDRRLIPELTVEENVLLPAWATNLDQSQTRLAQVYAMIPEVKTFADRKALQLSGGQQKLVALARALMCGTKLLLLDEPFEGVAPVLARRLAEVIRGLKNEGLTVIISESDLSHAADMLDMMYTIDRGEISQPLISTPVTELPTDPY